MRKQRNWEKQLAVKKSKRKEEKQRRKLNREQNPGTSIITRVTWHCCLSTDVLTVRFLNVQITETNKPNPQYPKRIMKEMARERLAEAKSTGPKLCVDLSMTDSMSDKVGD